MDFVRGERPNGLLIGHENVQRTQKVKMLCAFLCFLVAIGLLRQRGNERAESEFGAPVN